jgi:hypothetical protein
MAVSIATPFPLFVDEDGTPLDRGFVYVGTANQDPATNPASVYWDAALTVPASQPIRTSGGFLVDGNGAPGNIYCATDFSISVCDRNNAELYSADAYGARFLADSITFDTVTVNTSIVPDAAAGATNGSATLPWTSVTTRDVQTRTMSVYRSTQPASSSDFVKATQRALPMLRMRQTSTTATPSWTNILNCDTASCSRSAAGTYSVALTVPVVATADCTVNVTINGSTNVMATGRAAFTSTSTIAVYTFDSGGSNADLAFSLVVDGYPAVADPIS